MTPPVFDINIPTLAHRRGVGIPFFLSHIRGAPVVVTPRFSSFGSVNLPVPNPSASSPPSPTTTFGITPLTTSTQGFPSQQQHKPSSSSLFSSSPTTTSGGQLKFGLSPAAAAPGAVPPSFGSAVPTFGRPVASTSAGAPAAAAAAAANAATTTPATSSTAAGESAGEKPGDGGGDATKAAAAALAARFVFESMGRHIVVVVIVVASTWKGDCDATVSQSAVVFHVLYSAIPTSENRIRLGSNGSSARRRVVGVAVCRKFAVFVDSVL